VEVFPEACLNSRSIYEKLLKRFNRMKRFHLLELLEYVNNLNGGI